MTAEDAVAGIAATVTGQGLKCTAVLDDAGYPKGRQISDARMRHLEDRVPDRGAVRGERTTPSCPDPEAPRNQSRNRSVPAAAPRPP